MNIFEKLASKLPKSAEIDPTFPLQELTEILGFEPQRPEVYKLSLITRAALEKDKEGRRIDNERLEYLGDAVLESIVSVLRSKMVKRDMLNTLGEQIGLGKLLHGIKGKIHRNVYGNGLEALIGAVYLDRGYEVCKDFVANRLYGQNVNLDKLAEREENFKSRLMEWGQKKRKTITFEVFDEEPQPPNQTQFFAKVYIDGIEYGSGVGVAKRKAEQAASKQALRLIELGN